MSDLQKDLQALKEEGKTYLSPEDIKMLSEKHPHLVQLNNLTGEHSVPIASLELVSNVLLGNPALESGLGMLLEKINTGGHFQQAITQLLNMDTQMVTRESTVNINSTCPHQEFKTHVDLEVNTDKYMKDNLTRVLGNSDVSMKSEDLGLVIRLKTGSQDMAIQLKEMLSPLSDMFNSDILPGLLDQFMQQQSEWLSKCISTVVSTDGAYLLLVFQFKDELFEQNIHHYMQFINQFCGEDSGFKFETHLRTQLDLSDVMSNMEDIAAWTQKLVWEPQTNCQIKYQYNMNKLFTRKLIAIVLVIMEEKCKEGMFTEKYMRKVKAKMAMYQFFENMSYNMTFQFGKEDIHVHDSIKGIQGKIHNQLKKSKSLEMFSQTSMMMAGAYSMLKSTVLDNDMLNGLFTGLRENGEASIEMVAQLGVFQVQITGQVAGLGQVIDKIISEGTNMLEQEMEAPEEGIEHANKPDVQDNF